jgi:hypothetical protein
MASQPPVMVSTRSCTPCTTLLTPALTPVSSLRSATFLPCLPIITPASLDETIARSVSVVWAYSSSVLGGALGSPSGPRRASFGSIVSSDILPPGDMGSGAVVMVANGERALWWGCEG